MSERGPSNIERAFTVGGVEKSVEQRIYAVAQKVKETGVLDSSRFETDEDRKLAADDVIKSINPGFSSYEQVVNISRGETYSETQKKNARETFDVLRRSISLAMNDGSNQELQTRLFTGGLEEVLPKSFLYGKDNSSLNLVDGVREVTITSSVIRESLRELEGDRVYKRAKGEFKQDRELKAGLIEGTALKLIELDLPDDNEDELFAVRAYLNTQAGILRGELRSNDGSVDKVDQVAVLGKVTEAVEKMTEAAEKISGESNNGRVDSSNSSERNKSKGNRYEFMEAIDGENDPDKLRDIARIQLDKIEEREDLSNRYRLDGQPTWVLDEITFRLKNELIDKVKSDLALVGGDVELKASLEEKLRKYDLLRKEIQARLTIFDVGKLMSDAAYKLSDRGGIVDMIGQAANNNRVMDREVMGFLFRESKEAGIDIPTAWDLIQDANFNYEKILNDMSAKGWSVRYKGEKPFLEVEDSLVIDRSSGKRRKVGLFLDKDANPERAGLVEEYILSELSKDGRTGKYAKKAYQLANEIVSATAERSVFNFNLIKADTFADVIYFKAMRDDDARKGKNVGPVASRNIDSLAHGWLRYFSRSIDLTDNMGPIYAKDVAVEKVIGKEDSVGYFCKVLPAYVLTIKAALMDSDPDLKKILNLSHLQGLVSAFDKVDIPYRIVEKDGVWVKTEDKNVNIKSRCGIHNMKPLYALGLLELLVTKENLGMDVSSIRTLRELFVDTGLSETAKPFLSESQWKWCLEQKIAHVGRRDLTFIQAMSVNNRNKFIEGFWDYFLNGGAGKKRK